MLALHINVLDCSSVGSVCVGWDGLRGLELQGVAPVAVGEREVETPVTGTHL